MDTQELLELQDFLVTLEFKVAMVAKGLQDIRAYLAHRVSQESQAQVVTQESVDTVLTPELVDIQESQEQVDTQV